MLTSNLVRVRRKAGTIEPRWLKGAPRKRARSLAARYVEIFEAGKGMRREELDDLLGAVDVAPQDRIVAQGLRKLLEDRCEFECDAPIDPTELRWDVFKAAADQYQALGVKESFDREAVVHDVAARRGIESERLDELLFSDLRARHRMLRFETITAERLVERYDVNLAQALLLRAQRVVIKLRADSPDLVRKLFRAIRFHGLLYEVTADDEGRYAIALDGPFSLFESVQKYGLRLALVLPRLLEFEEFELHADIQWVRGTGTERLLLSPAHRLKPYMEGDNGTVGPDLAAFCEAFRKLGTDWEVRDNERLLSLPGHVVCMPDLEFEHRPSRRRAYLEAFGFWSRRAVFQRIELVRAGLSEHLVLAVSKSLRVSEDNLDDSDAGEIYLYRRSMSAKAVHERLEADRTTRSSAPEEGEAARN